MSKNNNNRIFMVIALLLVVVNVALGVLLWNSNKEKAIYLKQYNEVSQKFDELEKENKTNKEEMDKLKKDYDSLLKTKTNAKKRIIYLTFDDGPSVNTPKIVNILKEKNVKATFFVVNSDNSNGYKQILNSNNQLALHTYTHNYSKIYKSANAFIEDIKKIHNKVKNETGIDVKNIRFAGGSSNSYMSEKEFEQIAKQLKNDGYDYFDWNCDSGDASGIQISEKYILKQATACKMNNINLLMHDGGGHNNTVKALPKIIEHYQKEGYTFKLIDQNATEVKHKILK
ncbi:polysaccharide deacetylase family protein [Mycoplasma sp. P36-A1]|uniref:polysaccharide deacetylase family protein n=1 Tax=Mycoplasma sp. P36-A1 TaxID=3252900 RepID=UPI003C2BC673